jgi:hypothetical protein
MSILLSIPSRTLGIVSVFQRYLLTMVHQRSRESDDFLDKTLVTRVNRLDDAAIFL